MKRIAPAALAAFLLPAQAGVIGGPATFGMGGPEVDVSSLPAPAVGFDGPRIKAVTKTLNNSTRGAFRTECRTSHYNFDDWLLYRGAPDASHLHGYAGNTASNAMATFEDGNILNIGNSTCDGGTLNRSSYWSPVMIDTRTGKPVPMPGLGVYYKQDDVLPVGTQHAVPPPGMRMISGSMYNKSPSGPFKFTCAGKDINGVSVNYTTQSIPNCPVGTRIRATIAFPSCWNGELDSPDHRSHVTSPQRNAAGIRVCPPSHPLAIPRIEFNWDYPVTEADAPLYWRLSSDMDPSVPAGYSMHGDVVVGWDPEVMSTWIGNCLNAAQPKDCNVNFLGDGRALY